MSKAGAMLPGSGPLGMSSMKRLKNVKTEIGLHILAYNMSG
jgi:hypothetical protein